MPDGTAAGTAGLRGYGRGTHRTLTGLPQMIGTIMSNPGVEQEKHRIWPVRVVLLHGRD